MAYERVRQREMQKVCLCILLFLKTINLKTFFLKNNPKPKWFALDHSVNLPGKNMLYPAKFQTLENNDP